MDEFEEYYIKEGVSKNLNEYLDGNDVVDRFYDINTSIFVCPPLKDYGIYYFKYYNNALHFESTKVARISLLEPKYIIPEDNYKDIWILSDEEISELITKLKSMAILRGDNYPGCTVWEAIIQSYIYDGRTMGGITYPECLTKATMPDYTKLPREV